MRSMIGRRLLTVLKVLLSFLILVILLAPEWPAFQDERHRLKGLVGLRQFDFLLWEAGALKTKLAAAAGRGHTHLEQSTRTDIVLTYLESVERARALQGQVNEIYADPDVVDPALVAAQQVDELTQVRVEMRRLQPMAEAIIQEQVAAVLAEEGFASLGTVFPPVQMHMTQLPLMLIVSPREEIRQLYGIPLLPGVTISEREELEMAVLHSLDRSALVVPIGGLGFWPSMIVETSNVNFLADVVAHEWAHHWLTLRPLGVRYLADPQLRTINETVASIVGKEIGAKVMRRFYPQLVPPEVLEESEEDPGGAPVLPDPESPPPFDFQAQMAQTRIEVDRLLAEGKVTQAERYMEERRQAFVANGFAIRKLNQAYFAFYGAYADTPGASGDDPIGPAVLALRRQSPSLHAFLTTVSAVTSFDELQRLIETP